jgi:hypothetical protein
MKLKKALSGVLAAAMVVTLTPAMAFASTTNVVSNVQTFDKADGKTATIEMKISNAVNTQAWTNINHDVTLKLNNAKWDAYNGESASSKLTETNVNGVISADIIGTDGKTKTAIKPAVSFLSGDSITLTIPTSNASSASATYVNDTTNVFYTATLTEVSADNLVDYIDESGNATQDLYVAAPSQTLDTVPTLKVENGSAVTTYATYVAAGSGSVFLATDDIIKLTLNISTKSSSADKEVTISINDDNGALTAGTYTLGTVVSGKTVATVSDYGTDDLATFTVRNKSQKGSEITIKEATSGCLGKGTTQRITLTLPSEIEWNKVTAKGTLVAGGTVDDSGISVDSNNKRKITIEFTTSTDTSARRTLTIVPYIDTTKNVSEGEVTVTLRKLEGDITETANLVIGTVGESAIKVYVDEEDFKDNTIPSLYSGIVYATDEVESTDSSVGTNIKKYAVITLEETGVTDFVAGKWIDFTFDKSVQISGTTLYTINDGKPVTSNLEKASVTYDKNRNTFALQVPDVVSASTSPTTDILSKNAKDKIKIYIPITVEAGFDGDVQCTVTGEAAGVAETTVTVATATPVITVSADKSEVRTGIKNQAINNVVIKETAVGAINELNEANYIASVGGEGIYKGKADSITYDSYTATAKTSEIIVEFPFNLKDKPTVTVTDGDLDVEDVEWYTKEDNSSKNAIQIKIKADSVKEASEITISDIQISLDRTPAEGGYDINVYGSAVVQNAGFAESQAFANSYKIEDAINVVTPADSTTVAEKIQAEFVIGQTSYTNNGESVTMDAAPYIANSRTMVPIRYVANACGISENDITWNESTKTATINGLNTVVTIKMGSNTIQTSNGTITMDTVAVNNNGRIYVPLRFIANALGANVAWDASTKTITLTK